ncbi:MAG TPA: hypothetical protein VHE37_11665, partial [Nevskiaceae bacterium]|nr:hypothetical protein [Nevskiaceae bacterium]
ALGRRFPSRRLAVAFSSVAFFVTFVLVGIWHGPNWPFMVCGLFLGVGATVNQVTREIRARRGEPADTLVNRAIAQFWAGMTFCYIAVAITPFWLDPHEYAALLRSVLQPAALWVLPALFAVVGCVALLARLLSRAIDLTVARAGALAQSAPATALRFAVVLLYVLATTSALPDFVYKGI